MLVLENGAYGKRLGKVCEVMGVEVEVISFPENDFVDLQKVESMLKGNNSYTLVAMVHCETSSGVINPVEGVGKIVKQYLPGKCERNSYIDVFS